jgi:dienelactone hydrolase
MRERLALSLLADWPEQVSADVQGEKIVLSRPGKGDRVPGLWIQGKGPAALVVQPEGAEAARKSPTVAKLIASGRAVLLIDAFQTGSAVAPPSGSRRQFLTFNKSDDANRVQDILTALAYLKSKQAGRIELIGLGKAAAWSLFAAAVAPLDLKLTADLSSFQGTDEDLIGQLFVPGIQRAGGLKAALELTAERR